MFKRISSAILAIAATIAICLPVHAGPFAGGPVVADKVKSIPVSSLPPEGLGKIVLITDGATTTDCSTGGGANPVLCYHNGTAWTAIVSSGSTDLSTSLTWTIGTGAGGDVVLTFNGDGGTDGTISWSIAEDAFHFSRPIKLYADASLNSSGLIDDTGDIGFDISHWDTGRGTFLAWDGTGLVGLIGITLSDTCSPGEVPKFQSGGTWTCEADDDTGAPTIGDTQVAYATSVNAIGGEAAFYYDDTTNTLYVDAIVLAPSATPTSQQFDSDTNDGDASTQQVTNCTDTGSGTEDCDYTMSQQIAGAMTAFLTADADGRITVARLTAVTPNLQGAINYVGTAVNDDDCTGQQGSAWWDSTDSAFEWCNANSGAPAVLGGGSGAPTDADYLVGTANGSLSAEIVVGTSPGGELGNTWASPTIDDGLAVSNFNLTTPTITTSMDIGAAGVRITPDGDGAIALLGLGDGFDENLIINLDDVENEIHFSSATGVWGLAFNGFEIFAYAPDAASNINIGVCNTAGECGSMDFAEENADPFFLIGTEDALPMALYTDDTNRVIIQTDGDVQILDLASTYTGGSAYVCVNDAGELFGSDSVCP